MCRRYLQGSGTELDIDIFIPNDRNRPTNQRYNHPSIFGKMLITGIIRIDTKCRITQNGFGTSCSYHKILFRTFDMITQVIKLTLRLTVDHLLIRQGGKRCRVPVYHTYPAINLAFIVQIYKHLDDAAGHLGVHRKFGPLPIARRSQTTQLTENNATMFLFPLPSMFEKLLTSQRILVNTL